MNNERPLILISNDDGYKARGINFLAELLSPAGDYECLEAAVDYGCDAVYLGMTNFSARAFAGNFDREQLQEAVRYCHTRNVKVYVTMNTMLYASTLKK